MQGLVETIHDEGVVFVMEEDASAVGVGPGVISGGWQLGE
jgi:hypothetical protein